MQTVKKIAIVSFFVMCGRVLYAQPVAFDYKMINDFKIYKDARQANLFYYEPANFILSANENQKPDFKLLQMRYTGTRAAGDNGKIKFTNILQFKITADAQYIKNLQPIKARLQQQVANAVLKQLPVTKFESLLVYAPARNVDSNLVLLTKGYSEGMENMGNSNNSNWSERIYSIRLSDEDAQLIETALKDKQAAISMSYAFYSTFSAEKISDFTATLNNRVNKQLLQYFDSAAITNKDSLLKNLLVKADVVPVTADLEKFPDLVQKFDINEKIPPRYPLFDVYCYDFNNAIRPDLFEKKIDIEVTSVNGSVLLFNTTFKQSQPDTYAKSIRFPYAVRFDKPFRYRVTEINLEGEKLAADWVTRNSWSEIIDITSKVNKAVITIEN